MRKEIEKERRTDLLNSSSAAPSLVATFSHAREYACYPFLPGVTRGEREREREEKERECNKEKQSFLL